MWSDKNNGGIDMANSVRDYEKLAVDIIDAVGGKNNIIKASRCETFQILRE